VQRALQTFAHTLRRAGLRVSSAEMLDSLRACEALELSDAETIRAALATTLVKRSEDLALFEGLFDLYFRAGQELAAQAADAPLLALLDRMQLPQDLQDKLRQLLASMAAEMSAMGRAALGLEVPEIGSLVQAAGLAAELASMQSPMQAGIFSYRVLAQLDVDGAAAQAEGAASRLAALLAPDQGEQVAGLVASNLRIFRTGVRSFVEGKFQLQRPEYRAELRRASLADKALAQLSPADLSAMQGEVRRLARVFRSRMARRKHARSRGSLDLPRTMRSSLATGGVPFVLRHRAKPRRKPRLVVLCDVSDSVRNVSRFMLQFTYTLQDLFAGVRSFAFVAELGEASTLFARSEVQTAVEQTLSGAVVNVFSNSNYGQAFGEFAQRHLGLLNRRTTVLIIGDGRNNYHPHKAEIVGEMRRRCKELVWITPESRAAWGFGDSAMHEYQPHCDKVVVAFNLRSLQVVVEDLLEGDSS